MLYKVDLLLQTIYRFMNYKCYKVIPQNYGIQIKREIINLPNKIKQHYNTTIISSKHNKHNNLSNISLECTTMLIHKANG